VKFKKYVQIFTKTVKVVFEDSYVCCFLDHDPYNEGHVLVTYAYERYISDDNIPSKMSRIKYNLKQLSNYVEIPFGI
jgi:diadenosine tetraphosphate (Ap4A) HIT family hydrolase